jgi:hypothetical protein
MIQLLILIAVVIGFAKFFLYLGSRNSWIAAYQEVGRRYLGKKSVKAGVSCPTIISPPTLSFGYRKTHCTVATRRFRSFPEHRRVTQASILLPWKGDDWEVTTGEFNHWRLYGVRGRNRLTFEQLDFQANFKAAAKNKIAAKRQLDGQVRWQIEQLRRFSESNHVCVQVRHKVLTVSVPDDLRTSQRLDDFVRLSLKLYDLLLLTTSTGVSFIKDDSVVLVEEVQCPICSENVEQQMVVCIRCQTPHCRDCWEYNGQCATYACQETRFLDASTSGVPKAIGS